MYRSEKCPKCGGPMQCLTEQWEDSHPRLMCAEGSECPGKPCDRPAVAPYAITESWYLFGEGHSVNRDWRGVHFGMVRTPRFEAVSHETGYGLDWRAP